jgi:hypothetical protein
MGVKIASYVVGTHRPLEPYFVRHLYLTADAAETGVYKNFALYFTEDTSNELGIGHVVADTGYVVGWFPVRDFDTMYHILQTEKDVYVNWATAGTKLSWFELSTSTEPLGEGLTDRT